MTFDLTPVAAQHALARRTPKYAEAAVHPVTLDYARCHEVSLAGAGRGGPARSLQPFGGGSALRPRAAKQHCRFGFPKR